MTRLKKVLLVLAVCLGVPGAVASLAAASAMTAVSAAPAAPAEDTWVPPGDTITAVSGTARHVFRVDHHDGSSTYLPTLSEALAECGEYDAARERLRCRVEVRTRYHALGDTKRALRLAHAG